MLRECQRGRFSVPFPSEKPFTISPRHAIVCSVGQLGSSQITLSKQLMENRQKVVEFIARKSLESMMVKDLIQFYLEQIEESLLDETDEELVDYLDDYCEHGDDNDEFSLYCSYLNV